MRRYFAPATSPVPVPVPVPQHTSNSLDFSSLLQRSGSRFTACSYLPPRPRPRPRLRPAQKNKSSSSVLCRLSLLFCGYPLLRQSPTWDPLCQIVAVKVFRLLACSLDRGSSCATASASELCLHYQSANPILRSVLLPTTTTQARDFLTTTSPHS